VSAEGRSGPVVILTFSYSGASTLSDLLSAHPALFCTSGTGLLPVCHSAIQAWKKLEDRSGRPSALALASTRALATTMVATVSAAAGRKRWCETAFVPAAAAGTFLDIFPDTVFLCLYRSYWTIWREAANRFPYGLGNTVFWPYSGNHPGNNAATVANYWASWTEPLLKFEDAHPRSCFRVRYEDLVADSVGQRDRILDRLAIDHACLPCLPDAPVPADVVGLGNLDSAEMLSTLLPPDLQAKVTDFHAQLGYPVC
jgi:Sulfotransferase family